MDETTNQTPRTFDAVVVGAGFAGLYMLYRLRGLGLRVRVFEAGGGHAHLRSQQRPGAMCRLAAAVILILAVAPLDGRGRSGSAVAAEGVPAAPEDGGPRNWKVGGGVRSLNLRQQPSVTAKVLARYAPGTILDNLGCRPTDAGVWCDVQKLGGGPRGYVSAEFLEPAVSPDGSVKAGPDDSALRAGQGKFDATGNLPCAQAAGQPMSQCEFGVARAGGGYATVVVKRANDRRSRAIFFRMGTPIGADVSQADGDLEFRATKVNDLHLIRIGNERYEIPDAVVLGG